MANVEGNSEMVVGKCNSLHAKRKKCLTDLESLPDELLFDILVRLSAEDIYNGAMLVSRKWYDMIRTHDFRHAHLRHSTLGLLVHRENNASDFVAMRKGRIEVSKFNYIFRGLPDSCNGLILEFDFSKKAFQITNPAIKRHFTLPRFVRPKSHPLFPSIAYSTASKEYKVVRTYYSKDENSYGWRWAILTVGVDQSWRDICTRHISKVVHMILPLITEGFMHWHINDTHVLTLNVETEVMAQYPIPQGYEERRIYYLSTGKSSLSMLVTCGKFSFEVWEMKSETGEWSKMYNIDLEPRKCEFEQFRRKENLGTFMLVPAGWLKYQEVLVLRFTGPSRVCVAYNAVTRVIEFFELGFDCNSHRFKLHTNSLVWLT